MHHSTPGPNPHFHFISRPFQFTFSYLQGHVSSIRVVHAVWVISIILQLALWELRYSSCPGRSPFQELMHPFEYPEPTRQDLGQAKHLQVIGLHSFELQLNSVLHLALMSFEEQSCFPKIISWPVEPLTSLAHPFAWEPISTHFYWQSIRFSFVQ